MPSRSLPPDPAPRSSPDEFEELYALVRRLPGDEAPARARRLLEGLQRREARLRDVVNDLPELVFRFHAGGRITFVNPACCAYWKRPRVELLGRPVRSLLLEDGWNRLLRTARGLRPEEPLTRLDLRVIDRDHEPRWHEWSLRLIRPEDSDAGGNTVVGSAEYQVIARDVTERTEQQQVLAQHIAERRRAEKELRSVQQALLARIDELEKQLRIPGGSKAS